MLALQYLQYYNEIMQKINPTGSQEKCKKCNYKCQLESFCMTCAYGEKCCQFCARTIQDGNFYVKELNEIYIMLEKLQEETKAEPNYDYKESILQRFHQDSSKIKLHLEDMNTKNVFSNYVDLSGYWISWM